MKRTLAVIPLLILLFVRAQAAEHISAAEAVHLAEQFITEQGYTDQPALRDKLKPESFERPSEGIEVTLKLRHNSLKAKALGVLPYIQKPRPGESRAGWTVAFQWKSALPAQILYPVRIVTMKTDGSKPVLQHEMSPVGDFLRHR